MNQEAVIAFLSDPSTYGRGIEEVERHETHGSMVFLAGERAFKLKRAVRYPYMDYSTPARRRAMCEAELAVNRRMAPDLYLEVRAIVRARDGTLRFNTASDPIAAIDWVVVMKRFDQDALFEEMRKRGELSAPLMRTLAEVIAHFHREAEVRPRFGGSAGILKVIDENRAIFGRSQELFGRDRIEQYTTLARAAWQEMAELLELRRRSGFVRRCHGDLHLNNICLIGARPVLFDAIEFGEEFASIDVFYDLAFLLMDLERHKLRGFANIVLNRYLEKTQDFGGVAALPLFLSCRAAVRSHVIVAARGARLCDAETGAAAVSLLDAAVEFLEKRRAKLVVLGGLSGTGKSTLARAIASEIGRSPGAIVLRSDVIRKTICGVEETERLPAEGYSEEINTKVYATLAERANLLLRSGHSVIADAVFGQAEERQLIDSVARSAGIELRKVWLDAPIAILEQRLSARRDDASDATVAVLRRQAVSIDIPRDWPTLDVSGSPEDAAAALRGILAMPQPER
jgi:aminoglycoside phosphotransferase family enzyme/predicted kinase